MRGFNSDEKVLIPCDRVGLGAVCSLRGDWVGSRCDALPQLSREGSGGGALWGGVGGIVEKGRLEALAMMGTPGFLRAPARTWVGTHMQGLGRCVDIGPCA